MAFVTKTWKDRLVEYAGRRKLKNVSTGEETLMDVSRSEGTVNQEGDAFNATNMNDLEQRIKTEFDSVNSSLGGLRFGTDGDGNYGYYGADDSLIPFSSGGIIIPKITLSGAGSGYNRTVGSGNSTIVLNVESASSISFGAVSGSASIRLDSNTATTLSSNKSFNISDTSAVTIAVSGSGSNSQSEGGWCTGSYSATLYNIKIT